MLTQDRHRLGTGHRTAFYTIYYALLESDTLRSSHSHTRFITHYSSRHAALFSRSHSSLSRLAPELAPESS